MQIPFSDAVSAFLPHAHNTERDPNTGNTTPQPIKNSPTHKRVQGVSLHCHRRWLPVCVRHTEMDGGQQCNNSLATGETGKHTHTDTHARAHTCTHTCTLSLSLSHTHAHTPIENTNPHHMHAQAKKTQKGGKKRSDVLRTLLLAQ